MLIMSMQVVKTHLSFLVPPSMDRLFPYSTVGDGVYESEASI